MKNILVPVDFSDNAMNALDYACHIAEKFSADLHIIHAYQVQIPDTGTAEKRSEQSSDEIREVKLQKMEQFIYQYEQNSRSRGIHNLKIKLEAAENDIVDAIDSYANKTGCQMIVLGTKGGSSKGHEKMSQTTGRIIQLLHCPILAIPGKAHYKHPGKILFALDYEDFDYQKMKTLEEFAQNFECEITLLHINSLGYLEDEKFHNYKKAMDEASEYENILFDFINADNFSKAIMDYIDDHNIDILAMATRKRHLMQEAFDNSHTKDLVLHTSIPLLAFHD